MKTENETPTTTPTPAPNPPASETLKSINPQEIAELRRQQSEQATRLEAMAEGQKSILSAVEEIGKAVAPTLKETPGSARFVRDCLASATEIVFGKGE